MWLRQLRKLVSLYQRKCAPLRLEPRRARRRCAGLALEMLEVRTLPSTLTVANLNDSYFFSPGDGSLRGEIAVAQNGDTIQFSPALAGDTVVLIGGELLINKSLTIVGLTNSAGAPNITVRGFADGRDFDIEGSTSSFNVTIQDLNVSGGLVGDSAPNVADAGAGLLIQDVAGGTVTLTNLVVSGNTARGGNGGTPAAKTFTGAAGGSGNNAQGLDSTSVAVPSSSPATPSAATTPWAATAAMGPKPPGGRGCGRSSGQRQRRRAVHQRRRRAAHQRCLQREQRPGR